MIVALALVAALQPAALELGPSRPESYVGWFRLSAGGDVPVWLELETSSGVPVVKLSLPAQGTYGLVMEHAKLEEGGLTFSRKNKEGVTTTYTSKADGDLWIGEAFRDGTKLGELRVRRAAVRPTRGDGLVDAAGCYRADDGAVLRLSAWPWKELRCLDLSNGAERTLFVDENGELFAGTSLYGAARIEARYRLERDGSGKVSAMIRGERTYRRLEFNEREIEVGHLSGTLLVPDSVTPPPVVIILGGSDVKVRGDVRWEAEILASLGVAALSYDLSGRGKSGGIPIQSFDGSAQDVSAIVSALARRRDIDPRRIGLCGTSRGGWIGPLAASRDDRIAFLILLSAPAVSPRAQLTSCRLNFMRAAGYGEAELKEARAYLDLMWQSHRSEAGWRRYAAKRNEIERKGWLPQLQGPPSRDSEDYTWQKLNLDYEPEPALRKVRCPVLCLFGSADQVVEPSVSAPLFAAALAGSGNKDWTIKIIPDASHGLTLVDAKDPSGGRPVEDEYGFAPSAWETVRQWLSAR